MSGPSPTSIRLAGAVFLDAPLPNSFEQKYDDDDGGAFKITRNRTNNVGIENIRGNGRAGLTTSVAANSFVVMQNTSNGWVRNVTGQRLFYATVEIGTGSRNVTVDDATSIEPVSQMTGSSYPFNIEGQFSLMKNLVSDQGRHDFVNDSPSRGPNVFIDGNATRSRSDSGPHQSWATGTLFDKLRTAARYKRAESERDRPGPWLGGGEHGDLELAGPQFHSAESADGEKLADRIDGRLRRRPDIPRVRRFARKPSDVGH